jgi:hypothetical protein
MLIAGFVKSKLPDGFVDERRLRKTSYARRVKFIHFGVLRYVVMIEILYPMGTSCGAHNEADEEFLPSGHKYESIFIERFVSESVPDCPGFYGGAG